MSYKMRAGKLSVAILFTLLSSLLSTVVNAKELRILGWEGYADKDWIVEFKKETNIDVKVVFIGSDDELWAKIKGSAGKDFDLYAVNTAQLQRYIDAGLAAPHNLSLLPNQQKVLPRFRDLSKVEGVMRNGKVYGIPLAFDSIGLIYDTDKVKPAPTSMSVLWDPKYKGKTLLYDNGEHNFSSAALTLGLKDPFKLAPDAMQKVKQRLVELKKNALGFYTTSDEALQMYKSSDIALIWANYGQQQVKAMKDAGAHIAYINPKEGALAWLDTWVISSGAIDKESAEKWVNFMLQKKISQALSERTGFGNTVTPSASAGENDKIIYVKTVESEQKRSDLWNEIKATP